VACFAFTTGCGGAPLIDFEPGSLDWGEVDFGEAVPADGFSPTEVSITNRGETTVELTLTDFPFDMLCLTGFSEVPAPLPTLEPDQQALLTVAVCAYDAEGGRGVERSGDILIDADGEIESLPWSFTPVVDQSEGGR